MKKIILSILTLSILVLSTSCEKDFLDVNTNPNRSTDVPPGTLMTNALLALSQVRGTTTNPDGAAYVQQHKPVVVLTAPDTYNFSPIGNNNFYRYTFYGDVIKDLNLGAIGAEERGELNAVAQIRILQAWAWIQGADRWGEIPFVQANNLEFQFPQFDTGDVIYQGILDMLDDAISKIDMSQSATEPFTITDFDLVYSGDMDLWLRFANSLKLRILMRVSGVEDRASDITSLLASADFIEALDGSQDAKFRYVATRNNQNFDYATFDNFTQFASFQLSGDGTRVHQRWRLASSTMVNTLTANNDPRMFTYHDRDIGNPMGPITGAVNGDAALPAKTTRGYVSLFYIRQDKADDWFLASEYHLLAAEAYQRGLAPGGQAAAQTALEDGITASLNIYDGSSYEIDAADKTNFIDNELDLSSKADPLAFIHEQQWVSLFYNGSEAWSNWRRTKVPALTPAAGADIRTVISRLELPESAFININAPAVSPRIDKPVYFEKQ